MNANTLINIAIADDHKTFREGMEMALQRFPDMNLMIKASNGKDLLEQVKMNKPDVVLLDLQMPIMDGLTTLKEIKNLYRMIKVIILSINADSTDIMQAFENGADGYLLKTAEPMAITKAIRESQLPDTIL